MPLHISPLAKSHFEGLRRVLDVIAREKHYLTFFVAPAAEEAYAFYRDILAHNDSHYVALFENKVIGWCDVIRKPQAAVQHVGVLGVGVHPDHRGQGIATQLMQTAIAKAWDNGLTRIELTVRSDNATAIALYQHHGFAQEGLLRQGFLVDGAYFDVISMALLNETALNQRQVKAL